MQEKVGQKAPLRNTESKYELWIISESFLTHMPPSARARDVGLESGWIKPTELLEISKRMKEPEQILLVPE